ncbi:hypothetical protein CVT25_002504, partial [Psilocybe cyanescens]
MKTKTRATTTTTATTTSTSTATTAATAMTTTRTAKATTHAKDNDGHNNDDNSKARGEGGHDAAAAAKPAQEIVQAVHLVHANSSACCDYDRTPTRSVHDPTTPHGHDFDKASTRLDKGKASTACHHAYGGSSTLHAPVHHTSYSRDRGNSTSRFHALSSERRRHQEGEVSTTHPDEHVSQGRTSSRSTCDDAGTEAIPPLVSMLFHLNVVAIRKVKYPPPILMSMSLKAEPHLAVPVMMVWDDINAHETSAIGPKEKGKILVYQSSMDPNTFDVSTTKSSFAVRVVNTAQYTTIQDI